MREAAASIVMGSLESLTPSSEELRFISQETSSPGIVLFKRNLFQENPSVLKTQIVQPFYDQISPKYPLLFSVDQEGGRVHRLGLKFPNQGPALRVSVGTHDEALKTLHNYGHEVGIALANIGINVNFAPVVDILSNPLNIGIGDRAFAVSSASVIKRAGAYLSGLQSTGVLGCLKHFPGQGSELSDPHHNSVTVNSSTDLLEKRELAPYRALLTQTKLIMISHCIFPAVDDKPASLSEKAITGLLKNKLGYRGLVVSDDMNMKAIAQDIPGWKEAIITSVAAGAHLLLVCSGLDKWAYAIEALEQEARKSSHFEKILKRSAEHVRTFRKTQLLPRS